MQITLQDCDHSRIAEVPLYMYTCTCVFDYVHSFVRDHHRPGSVTKNQNQSCLNSVVQQSREIGPNSMLPCSYCKSANKGGEACRSVASGEPDRFQCGRCKKSTIVSIVCSNAFQRCMDGVAIKASTKQKPRTRVGYVTSIISLMESPTTKCSISTPKNPSKLWLPGVHCTCGMYLIHVIRGETDHILLDI